MTRYIDADKLTDLCKQIIADDWNKRSSPNSWSYAYEAFIEDIDEQPTADVVEVRHGEWKQKYEKAPRYMCSSCNHLFNNKDYHYCPNCGAKMDGKAQEEGENL